MKSVIKCITLLLIIPVLCNCGTEQCIYRTEDGLYAYNSLIYKNDGEIFLSEKEQEYVEPIAAFQEGMKGAEWYTGVSQYGKWFCWNWKRVDTYREWKAVATFC